MASPTGLRLIVSLVRLVGALVWSIVFRASSGMSSVVFAVLPIFMRLLVVRGRKLGMAGRIVFKDRSFIGGGAAAWGVSSYRTMGISEKAADTRRRLLEVKDALRLSKTILDVECDRLTRRGGAMWKSRTQWDARLKNNNKTLPVFLTPHVGYSVND